jgi:sugar lactone lactonase YvrE
VAGRDRFDDIAERSGEHPIDTACRAGMLSWDPVVAGLDYPESLRWHDGALWFSDFYQQRVVAVGPTGAETILAVPGQPSGLGWLPDGSLLVVEMRPRRVLRVSPGRPVAVHADLGPWCAGLANDMLVAPDGSAYVGHLGFDFFGGGPFATAELLLVDAAGSVSVAAKDLAVPNGCLLADDGETLIVAETFRGCLTSFRRAPDGTLSERRSIRLTGVTPDGICGGADGEVWVADPPKQRIVRVANGRVAGFLETPSQPFSCVLGGKDRRLLYVGVADGHDPASTPGGSGRILAVRVDEARSEAARSGASGRT